MAQCWQLSDELWDVVSDLFTELMAEAGRLMLDGVLWVLCSGAAWRDMPERFGPGSTVYKRFRDWRHQGASDQIAKRLHLRSSEQG